MPRRVEDLYFDVTSLDPVAVAQGMKIKLDHLAIRFMEAVLRAGTLCQIAPTGIVIGVDMGIDHVRDLDADLACLLQEPLLITLDDVHGNRLAERPAPKQIGQ